MPPSGKVYLGEVLISGAPIEVSEDNPLPVYDGTLRNLMRGVLNMLQSPLGYDSSQKRFRNTVVVEGGTINNINGTLSTLGNITAIGGDQPQLLTRGANQTAWALLVRARIT